MSATDDNYVRPILSSAHKWFLLFLFCFAEFMDAFIASALFPGVNDMIRDLNLVETDATWIFAAYAATFAGFLLISGRIADVYSASQYHLFLQPEHLLIFSIPPRRMVFPHRICTRWYFLPRCWILPFQSPSFRLASFDGHWRCNDRPIRPQSHY